MTSQELEFTLKEQYNESKFSKLFNKKYPGYLHEIDKIMVIICGLVNLSSPIISETGFLIK